MTWAPPVGLSDDADLGAEFWRAVLVTVVVVAGVLAPFAGYVLGAARWPW